MASHLCKLAHAARITSALFGSIPSTTPRVGTVIHVVNQTATLIQVEIQSLKIIIACKGNVAEQG